MGSILWMALTIPAVTHGGIGKHIWDVTYMEFFWYFKVKQPFEYIIVTVVKSLTRIVVFSLLESNKLSFISQLA